MTMCGVYGTRAYLGFVELLYNSIKLLYPSHENAEAEREFIRAVIPNM